MTFSFSVPGPKGNTDFHVQHGTSLLFVGANGGGKTRLAVKIEEELQDRAHRISAHRALSLNPRVTKIDANSAIRGLRYGHADPQWQIGHRVSSRWKGHAATALLNDYDLLLQCLFAEQTNTSLQTHKDARLGSPTIPKLTNFERLSEIWNRLLPHRTLEVTGDDIKVAAAGSDEPYQAEELSDGERAIFYLIGQTLTASKNSLIIFDEPELHIHRAIMSRLWDELEATRPDCATLLITHDLEFAASREGQKFVVRDYSPKNGWSIEQVPDDTGFTEEISTLILGSRRPILFVEGNETSLDQTIYRACYPDWTILPRGSCEEVIHSVTSMRSNSALTRVTCAGIVDADAYDESDILLLRSKGIAILPVSEIENIFLMPSVIEAIAKTEGYDGPSLEDRTKTILDELFSQASDPRQQLPIVLRYCRRRIDRTLKKVDLSDADSVTSLSSFYSAKTSALDISALAQLAETSIHKAITERNAPDLLRWYDNKGILGIACKVKGTTKPQFEQWIARVLRNDTAPALAAAIRNLLPVVEAR
jgi:AAA domain, putative AbiEii toxin, Type IV TA system/Protein of unknown function (DUF4435)